MGNRCWSRRRLLGGSAAGFGWLAASSLLARESAAAGTASGFHLPARARRVIFLFMMGGPSQVDTFDPKPQLALDDGKELPFAKPRVQFGETGKILASPWKFRPYGQSGIQVSELFPHVARHVDDICFLHSLHGTNPAHGGAVLKLHTGSETFVRPSMGAWLTYGLGTENDNLPGFLTICPSLGHGGSNNWGAAFLPPEFQGVPVGIAGNPSKEAQVKFIANRRWPREVQRTQLDLFEELSAAGPVADTIVDARIKSFELAFRMQAEMPGVQDISGETARTLSLYGLDDPVTEDFGRQCLLARRFAEAGVRFIQVTHSDTKVQWDQHADLVKGHTAKAAEVDKPIAGLLTDLKERGLLDDTLVLWGGEFGRTPVAQGKKGHYGRDHNPEGFTMWMAGGGVKGGYRYGTTDDYGYYAVENKMHIHDLHATLLHLLGVDHLKLTYRHAGRDFRLTDVAGKVHKAVLA